MWTQEQKMRMEANRIAALERKLQKKRSLSQPEEIQAKKWRALNDQKDNSYSYEFLNGVSTSLDRLTLRDKEASAAVSPEMESQIEKIEMSPDCYEISADDFFPEREREDQPKPTSLLPSFLFSQERETEFAVVETKSQGPNPAEFIFKVDAEIWKPLEFVLLIQLEKGTIQEKLTKKEKSTLIHNFVHSLPVHSKTWVWEIKAKALSKFHFPLIFPPVSPHCQPLISPHHISLPPLQIWPNN